MGGNLSDVMGACLLLGTLGGCIFMAHAAYRGLRLKGYKSPLHAVLVAIPPVAGFAAPELLALDVASADFATTVIVYLAPFMLGSSAAALTVVRVLPQQARRTFGPRTVRMPWTDLGAAVFVLACVATLAVWRNGLQPFNYARIWAAAFGLGSICLGLGRRARSPGFAEATAVDPRRPVLYLRAFYRERLPFAEILPDAADQVAPEYRRPGAGGVTLEAYFKQAISSVHGPLVALGNPEDYLPPEGAARLYAEDDAWQDHFDEIVRHAVWIVVQVEDSENLHWEFQRLRALGLHEKLFIVTRPWRKAKWTDPGWPIRRTRGETDAVPWAKFAERLAAAGYRLDSNDPGHGAVIAIDHSGAGVQLAAGARTPSEFLDPVAEWLRRMNEAPSPRPAPSPRSTHAEGVSG